MNHSLLKHVRLLAVCICGLFVMLMFTACEGIANSNTANGGTQIKITGQVKSVDSQNHTVTLSVGGQSYTVNSLTDAQISQLQQQVGKNYTIVATQNADGSYSIVFGTNPVVVTDNSPQGVSSPTPVPTSSTNNTDNAGPPAQGKIEFVGKVQNWSANQVVATLPNGDSLTIAINTITDNRIRQGINSGQSIYIKAQTNPDGSLVASKVDYPDNQEQNDPRVYNEVKFTGYTVGPVGADNVIHFKVGTKVYSATIVGNTDIHKTNGVQSLANNVRVKVDARYSGSSATALQVELADTNND